MATPSLPSEQLNPKTLYTITGAAAAVWLFGAVLYTVLGPKVDGVFYRAIAFGLSIIIAVGMLIEKKNFKLKYWLLVIPNSALIFVNASGYNAVNNGSVNTPGVEENKSAKTTNETSMQQAAFFPFLKDVAWWPDPALNEKIEQLKKTNDSLLSENKTIKEKLSVDAGNSAEAIADKNKIAELEKQVLTLQQENNSIISGNNTNTNLSATIAGLQKQLADKNNQLKSCFTDLQKTKNELTSVTNQLNNCLTKGNSNDALNNRITSLNNQLTQAKKDFDACEGKLKDAVNTIQSLNNQLNDCKNKPGDLKDGSAIVKEMQKRVESLQNDLAGVRGQLSKCQTALAEANSRNSGDESKQVNDLQSKLNSCNGELEKCNSQLRYYQTLYKTCTGQLGSVRDSLNRCLKPKIITQKKPN